MHTPPSQPPSQPSGTPSPGEPERGCTRIWIDADACPRAVKDIIYRAAERTRTPTILVANSGMSIPRSQYVTMVVVGKGLDVADDHIAENVMDADLVVTADVPLADKVVSKGALAINPRGELYTAANVKEKLSLRDFMQDLRSGGLVSGGPPALSASDVQKFANAFDRELTKKLKGRNELRR